ncbi:hypothetical protein [Hallella bergensis]|uniref:hypothetical protein n=1 Tax=Hallella bergensis TaxID=242750 RepID=UPI0039909D1A
MKHKNIQTFYLKVILLSFPFLLLIAYYVIKDPFMVIRSYTDYDHSKICLSEGAVGWIKYKQQRAHTHYDSFIMGSSCTKAFNTTDWKQYINGTPFRFFGNNERLGDVLLKLEALDKQPHQTIKHLLIVADYGLLAHAENEQGLNHIVPPEVSGKSYMSYQLSFLQGFLSYDFLSKYLTFQWTQQYQPNMNGVINKDSCQRTRLSNDAILPAEKIIATQKEKFWQTPDWLAARQNQPQFTTRDITMGTKHLHCLRKIKDICDRHHTDVRVVIGPDFQRRAINPTDVAMLYKIFGQTKVLDFSDSAHLQYTDYHYYYDPAHYRIGVGKEMLRQLYTGIDKTKETPRKAVLSNL